MFKKLKAIWLPLLTWLMILWSVSYLSNLINLSAEDWYSFPVLVTTFFAGITITVHCCLWAEKRLKDESKP